EPDGPGPISKIKDDRVSSSLLARGRSRDADAHTSRAGPVFVACPDARPPAYQAVVGLGRAGLLHTFLTAFYYGGDGALEAPGRRIAPTRYARWERLLRRRNHPEIPSDRVRSAWSYDLALAAEGRLAPHRPEARGAVARWRTRRFDRSLARR